MDRVRRIRVGIAATGVGPVGARRVRDRFGGWEEAAREAPRSARVPPRLREAFASADRIGHRVLDACSAGAIRILFRGAPDWPAELQTLTDPPEVMFVRGHGRLLGEPAVAVVGTRESSASGERWTGRLAERMADAGWAVVSGLARGIDTAAHRGALRAGGDTIAVLGCGPDVPYPPENRELLARIADEGAVISEFAPGTEPRPYHFPRRNRVLAALSQAIVVVECRRRSGAMVTARHALDLGREVYVVPGWPESAVSDGPLHLLRDGARPIRHAEDLLEDLGGIAGQPAPDATGAETLNAIGDGTTAEELACRLGIPEEEARERVARLELMGLAAPEGFGGRG